MFICCWTFICNYISLIFKYIQYIYIIKKYLKANCRIDSGTQKTLWWFFTGVLWISLSAMFKIVFLSFRLSLLTSQRGFLGNEGLLITKPIGMLLLFLSRSASLPCPVWMLGREEDLGGWVNGGGGCRGWTIGSIFPWTPSISTAYFCQVLGDEANYPAIHLLALHPNLSIPPPSLYFAVCAYMHVCVCVCVCVFPHFTVCAWTWMCVFMHVRLFIRKLFVSWSLLYKTVSFKVPSTETPVCRSQPHWKTLDQN